MNYLNLILVLVSISGIFFAFNMFRVSGAKEIMDSAPLPITSPTQNPANLNYQQNQPSDYQEFLYPNATPTNSDFNAFTSSDDSSVITEWYKEKIKSLGMNTTSFIQTNTNGFILNKLVASNGVKEINIEISKKNNEQEVSILLNADE